MQTDLTQKDIDDILSNLDNYSPAQLEELSTIVDELDARAERQAAHDSLVDFCCAMQEDYKVGAHHKRLAFLLEEIEEGHKDRICVSVPPRHGKLCAHDTIVPTPKGYVRHGDIVPGDYVFGLDGHPVEVVAVSPEGVASYEVELTNGEVVKVHGNHEWSVYDRRKGGDSRALETHETHKLAEDFWIGPKGVRGGRARWQLPDAQPLEYPAERVPLHPYALGVWLGDGTTTKPTITGVDMEVFGAFEQCTGYTAAMSVVHKDTGVTTKAYAGPRPKVRGQLSESLFSLGLLKSNRAGEKRIPPSYKYNSVGVRSQLLAGLIDTDGHVEKHTGRVRIVTACANLAEDIREVATSLGFRPYITSQEPATSSSGIVGKSRVYTVGFQPTFPLPTVLPRKAITKFSMRRKVAIKDIRRCDGVPGRCIQVANADGLYLVGKTHSPTHNSQMVSIFYAGWYLGRNPTHKVMLVSHTSDLAVDFGRKVRNLIASPKYQSIFPGVSLAADSKSAGRWNTNHGGEFFAAGVGSALAGRGAHLLLVDDPHSEQDVLAGNFDAFEKAYQWFAYGARTRLMPGGRVAIVHTRWHQDDLIGRVTRDMTQNEDSDQYEVFEFPAIFETEKEDGTIEEKALWPEFFDIPALKRTKASMPIFQWNAQYQQKPTAEEGSIIKREWWQIWGKDRPPACDYIIMSLDAAAEAHNRADYTSLTTWGVFHNDDTGVNNIILLNAVKQRLEFPELKEMATREYKEWQPDVFIVEKKSSGTPLYQEMRRSGLLVAEYTPSRGSANNPNTKMARLNSVADIIKSGLVWVPTTRWGEDLVEEVAGFPFMSNDDQVDTTIMAMMRFREGGFIRLPQDEHEEMDEYELRKPVNYY